MRLDRHDIFPLSVVLLFGVVIPLALWLGFGTPQQIAHDFYGAAKTFTIASVAFAVLIGCLSIIARSAKEDAHHYASEHAVVSTHSGTLSTCGSEFRALRSTHPGANLGNHLCRFGTTAKATSQTTQVGGVPQARLRT